MLLAGALLGFIALLPQQGEGHMSLQEPPARNVLWRMGYNHLPRHREDDYLICYEDPGKRCPPCGDAAEVPRPRPHEGGGKYATGIIGRTYNAGQKIPVEVNVTLNHGGTLEFRLCPHNKPDQPVSQRCLDQYPLEVVGSRSRSVPLSAPHRAPYYSQEMINVEVQLPEDVTCEQCVLQMTNTAEEFKPNIVMFRNCADVAIVESKEKPRRVREIIHAKTNMAAGPPREYQPVENRPFEDEIGVRFGGGFEPYYPEQKQHRLYN